MARREPDGDTGVEVAIDRIRDIERELEDLKAFVAGKLPHNHDSRYDGRYVHESGDTMSGDLLMDQGGNSPARWDAPSDSTREYSRVRVGSTQVIVYGDNDGSAPGRVLLAPVDPEQVRVAGDARVTGNFSVDGSKNAEIPDPDDATKAFRFAAVEADEPGLLFHRRTVTIPEGNGGEATVDLPAHWSRIATAGDAMVTPLDDTRDQAPAAAAVDLSVPEVTVRGKPGDYRVWVCAARADAGVAGWTHEVEVTPDDEDV